MDDNERTWEQSMEFVDHIVCLARRLPSIMQTWQIQEAFRLNQPMTFLCHECGGWSPPLTGDDLLSACPKGEFVCQGNCVDD